MKRTISMILAILMLLPMIASMAIAVSPDDIVITDEPQNIAHIGEFTITEGSKNAYWEPEYLIDKDKEVGTLSPRGRSSAFKLNLGKEFYISEFVVVVNGDGELLAGAPSGTTNRTKSIQVIGYDDKGDIAYISDELNTTEMSECKFELKEDVIEIEVKLKSEEGTSSSYCSVWEVEAYTVTAPPRCDAEQTNIASSALMNSTIYDKEKGNVTSSWWAMDLSRLIDGDEHTGTHTVKGGAFSLWFYFGQEKLMSEIKVHTNGNGALSPATGIHTKDIKDSSGQVLGEGVDYFNSYQLTIVLYDFNDEIVYQSEDVDVSSLTEYAEQIGVNAATVELKISNAGGAGQGGGIFIWDVEIYEETGEHMYELSAQENPSCGYPGYKQYQCLDPDCAMKKIETIPATGYHEWNEGVVSNDPKEDANGTKILTCSKCGGTTNRDVPALGHNWDNGTVIEPDCDDGYTEYKCTDSGCNLTYRDNFISGIGHKYGDGVVTKRATIDEEGEMSFVCLREGCGEEYVKKLRKSKYIDSTVLVDNSIVTRYEGYQTIDKTNSSDAYTVLGKYVFDGITNDGLGGLGGGVNYWFSPGERTTEKGTDENGKEIEIEKRQSGLLYIYLDKEYYFTKGMVYAAANWRWFEIHFEYQENGNWVRSATYVHDRLNNMTVSGLDITPSLNFGARASRIVIESVNGDYGYSWADGPEGSPNLAGRLQIHELVLEAHQCNITPDDYEPEANWKKPTCTTPGSCKATCPVCGAETKVSLSSKLYAHEYGEVSVVEAPTCSTPGVGEKTCSLAECGYTATVEIPATGKHDYTKDKVFMPADCSTVGLGQKVCSVCDDVNYQYPIEPTGNHEYEYIVKSEANYTAIGKDVYACKYCQLKGDKEDIIHDKLVVPENFVTFQGYSIRMTDYVGIRASFKFDQAILDELEKTCDVTITIYAKNVASGKVVSAQAYGKKVHYSNTEKFNENNEFSAVAKVTDCKAEYEFSYEIKLVNFRGTEIVTVAVPGYTNGKTTTTVKEIASDAIKATTINSDVKKFLEEVIAE